MTAFTDTRTLTPEPVTGGGADDYAHLFDGTYEEWDAAFNAGVPLTAVCGARRPPRSDYLRLPKCPLCFEFDRSGL